MEINKEIAELLEEHNIDVAAGTLYLLGIYFNLKVDSTCPDEVIKAVNVLKIVEKDYSSQGDSVVWNTNLFTDEDNPRVTAWSWVRDWVEGFAKINPSRKGSTIDTETRMKIFFGKYPQYRVEDVYKARDMYFQSVKDPQYLRKSHKFIFEGQGKLQTSDLLTWCEAVVSNKNIVTHMKGRIIK